METADLVITTDERSDTVVILVAGEVDLATSTTLKRALDELIDRVPPPSRIVADLAGVGFMDTSGVAVLLSSRRRASDAGSTLLVSATSPFLAHLFDVTGIGRVLLDHGA
jgi:anti-sigma B factor antagonist